MNDPSTPGDKRAKRLAEQLRANLHRRKAQARGIDETPTSDPAAERPDD